MIVLVTGATGKQGGAVAEKLLSDGHEVRALSRRVDSEAAEALRDQGAEVVAGSLDNAESLRRAAEGVDGIFGMTTPFEEGIDAEIQQGRNLVDAAANAGANLVFTSVGWAYRNTGIPHFETKWQTEKYLTSKDIPHTIVGPGFFMENLIAPWSLPALKNQGVLAFPLGADVRQCAVAVSNIADVAVYALEHPEEMNGKRFDVVGDILTGPEIAAALSEVLGGEITYYDVPKAGVESDDLRKMYEWYETSAPVVDIAELKATFS